MQYVGGSWADLSNSILHLLEVCLLVEMAGHDFGQQSLQNAGSSKQNDAGTNTDDGDVGAPQTFVLVGRGPEQASKQGHDEPSPEQALHARLHNYSGRQSITCQGLLSAYLLFRQTGRWPSQGCGQDGAAALTTALLRLPSSSGVRLKISDPIFIQADGKVDK